MTPPHSNAYRPPLTLGYLLWPVSLGLGIFVVLRVARVESKNPATNQRPTSCHNPASQTGKPGPGHGHCDRGVGGIEHHQELEHVGRPVGIAAVVEVAEEVAEEALLALVRLGREMDIDNQILNPTGVFKLVKLARLYRCCALPVRPVGQDGEGLRVEAAVEVADARLQTEIFVLVDVVMMGRRNNRQAVFSNRGRNSVRHDEVRTRRSECD